MEKIHPQWNNPSGLNKSDTLEDALLRADTLSDPYGTASSGMMCSRKDLRRIVLLAREHRRLLKETKELKSIIGTIRQRR